MTGKETTPQAWRDMAERYREFASFLLKRKFEPCFIGEANPCGGSDAEHVAAYMGKIMAVFDHFAVHESEDFAEELARTFGNSACDLFHACDTHDPAVGYPLGKFMARLASRATDSHPLGEVHIPERPDPDRRF